MRTAVLIITIICMFVVGIQSCFVGCGASVAEDEQLQSGSSMGIMVALLYLMAAIFITANPKITVAIFALAAALGLVAGATTDFIDMTIWGVISLILAVMSFFAARKQRKEEAGETR